MLWDGGLSEASDDVEVTVPQTSRPGNVPGVRVTRRALSEQETLVRRAVPVTTPLRTALDLARIQPTDDAVIALDRFLSTGLVFFEELRAAAALATGRDCRAIRRAAASADGLAESPQETRVRLLLKRSPLPDPVARFQVRDEDGRRVARVDFAWPEHRVALEYDGGWNGRTHAVPPRPAAAQPGSPQRHLRDRRRPPEPVGLLLRVAQVAGCFDPRLTPVSRAGTRHPAHLDRRVGGCLSGGRTTNG